MKILKKIGLALLLSIIGLVVTGFGNYSSEFNLFKFVFTYQPVSEKPLLQPSSGQLEPYRLLPEPARSNVLLSPSESIENMRKAHRAEYESCKTLQASYKQHNAHNKPSQQILALQRAELEKCATRLAQSTREQSEIEAMTMRLSIPDDSQFDRR